MLKELKSYLNITWDDEDPDLEKIIKRGEAYLESISGTKLDFKEDLLIHQLLLDYGRYVYNNTFELFGVNFRRELLALSLREAVKDRANKKADSKADTQNI